MSSNSFYWIKTIRIFSKLIFFFLLNFDLIIFPIITIYRSPSLKVTDFFKKVPRIFWNICKKFKIYDFFIIYKIFIFKLWLCYKIFFRNVTIKSVKKCYRFFLSKNWEQYLFIKASVFFSKLSSNEQFYQSWGIL